MRKRIRVQLSFANVMSVIAVFIAIGGGAYAAKQLNGKTIKKNSIPANRLKKSVLTGLDKCPSAAPSNTVGICYGLQLPGADWDIAARDCAAKGLRLPDLGEGLLVVKAAASPYLWTTDVAQVSPAPSLRTIVRTDDTGFSAIAVFPKAGPVAYRCVIEATS
jgi:hypothetical protein